MNNGVEDRGSLSSRQGVEVDARPIDNPKISHQQLPTTDVPCGDFSMPEFNLSADG